MKSFFKYLLVLLSGFFILFFILLLIILSLSPSEPIVNDNSYLHMTIGGSIPEYIAPSDFEELTGNIQLDMKKIRDNLEKAAIDDRINVIILNLGIIQVGYAKIQELRHYINLYRQSGKKIYAFFNFATTKEYLLATACDSIFMPETANLFLTGIGASITFYKGLFEKIGVEADFVHVGKYKNAPDTYTRKNMSDYQKEVLNNILDQFYENLVETISFSRNIPADELDKLIDNISGFSGKDALKAGLIDGNLYKDDIINLLDYNSEIPERINGASYSVIPASSLNIRTKSRIAVIHVSGTISSGNDTNDPLLGKLAGSGTIVSNIQDAADSRSVKAIILRIDSPGGSATASDHIWKAAYTAAQKKPVVASISDYGASGGYYVAIAADTIISNSMSIIGSIGIYAGKFSLKGLYKKIGLTNDRLLRGRNAALFSSNSLWSDSEREVIQRLIKDFYIGFVTKVSASRNMSYEAVEKIAQGRVWSGEQGMKKGLADSIGTFYDAVKIAKRMAGINPNESVRLSYFPKKKELFSELYRMIQINLNKVNIFEQIENSYISKYQNKPLTLMPFVIEWN